MLGFLYNGLQLKAYYIETIIMLRKLAIVVIFVAFYKLGRIVQVLILLAFMISSIIYSVKKRPYLTWRLNQL